MKISQGDEKLQSKLKEYHGTATDLVANKSCKIKIRAVGLDQDIVRWIDKNLRGLKDCFDITQIQKANIKMIHP